MSPSALSDNYLTCSALEAPLYEILINSCFATKSHDLVDYVNIFAVVLAAIFAGVSALCAKSANKSFMQQANAERFDHLIGNAFLVSLRKTRAEFQKLKSHLISATLTQAKERKINTSIMAVQNTDLFSQSTLFDEYTSSLYRMQNKYEDIETQLAALSGFIQQRADDWHVKATACMSSIEEAYTEMNQKYLNARKTYRS